MILILTSSPCLDGDCFICQDNDFLARLKSAVKPGSRVLFVSAAPDDAGFSDYCASSMFASLTGSGVELQSYESLDRRTQGHAAELIANAEFIIIGGGHVPTQNIFLAELNLRSLIKSFDGVIMGISAGSMNCADIVYAQPEEPGESIAPDYCRFPKGLGLTKTNILPHFQKTRHYELDGRRLYEDITCEDSFGHRFYAMPDGAYLWREKNQETIYGDCWLIADGVMRKVCEKDQSLMLCNDIY